MISSTIQYREQQCKTVKCTAERCSAVQCSDVQCSTVQCSAVQCSAAPSTGSMAVLVVKRVADHVEAALSIGDSVTVKYTFLREGQIHP